MKTFNYVVIVEAIEAEALADSPLLPKVHFNKTGNVSIT
jgi:hypothetical protein